MADGGHPETPDPWADLRSAANDEDSPLVDSRWIGYAGVPRHRLAALVARCDALEAERQQLDEVVGAARIIADGKWLEERPFNAKPGTPPTSYIIEATRVEHLRQALSALGSGSVPEAPE